VLVRQSAEADLAAMVARIKAEINQNAVVVNDEKVCLTVSVGGQRSGEGCEDYTAVISSADKALYAAKEKGVNGFVMGGNDKLTL